MTVQDGQWQDVLLEDLAAPIRNALVGGPFGSELVSSDYVSTGVPVIRGENLSLGRWVSGEFVHVSEAKAQKLAANTAGPLDIVFTQRGANHYRQVAVMPAATPRRFVISQSQMKVTVDRTKADPLFVYYLFRAPEQQGYLQRHAIQTGVPHTNLFILRRIPLRIPSLSEQRAIVSVLGALDDKIELNRRANQTLEAIARAIFKSWFVDFDPVRAKTEGRKPFGMDAETARSLPDNLLTDEDGAVPSGWQRGVLGQLVETRREMHDPTSIDPATAYIGLEHMPRGSLALDEWETAAKVTSTKFAFRKHDLLFGKLRPYFKKVGIVNRPEFRRDSSYWELASKGVAGC